MCFFSLLYHNFILIKQGTELPQSSEVTLAPVPPTSHLSGFH